MPLEVAQGAAVPSYVLLSALAARFRDTRFSLVIGMDLVPTLPKWTFAGGLLAHVSFLVVPRPGYDNACVQSGAAGCSPHRMETLQLADNVETVEVHLSSSEVRQRVKHMVSTVWSGASSAIDGTTSHEVLTERYVREPVASDPFTGLRAALCGLIPPYVTSRLLDAEPAVHPRKQLLALAEEPPSSTIPPAS
jgi:hypothetical protein